MKYFLIRKSSGDDNDNFVRHYVDWADNRLAMLDKIESEFMEDAVQELKDDVQVDGDGEYLGFLWFEYQDDDGCDTTNPDYYNEGRAFHEDYFIEGEYDTYEEAHKAMER